MGLSDGNRRTVQPDPGLADRHLGKTMVWRPESVNWALPAIVGLCRLESNIDRRTPHLSRGLVTRDDVQLLMWSSPWGSCQSQGPIQYLAHAVFCRRVQPITLRRLLCFGLGPHSAVVSVLCSALCSGTAPRGVCGESSGPGFGSQAS